MNTQVETMKANIAELNPLLMPEAFSRLDDSDDRVYYSRDRFVSHLDSLALQTVGHLIGSLIVEKDPVILDLMAGWDSHLPETILPAKVIGLGLNEEELKANKALTDYVLHDLNREPLLPFPDHAFDAVINTVSVDYMTRPPEVFREVGRILKPGGLFLVIFSNRMFPQKAVKVWRDSSEEERLLLVEDLFNRSGIYEKPSLFVSRGKPRPPDDKYAHLGIPSDPVYAVYADTTGATQGREPRPEVALHYGEPLGKEELQKREKAVKHTLSCPHCGEKLSKWEVPHNPFAYTWDNDFMYICFNDACPYFVRGWDFMSREGNRGVSYRLMYNPEKDCCQPIPVPSHKALREGIID
ncbi:MAG: class I SAM-dependent methyltransferase [Deltaproteobacteria bacterium]|nr:class I SAM-dependent methyltransferase [Deltaproteobacteria bacterium]